MNMIAIVAEFAASGLRTSRPHSTASFSAFRKTALESVLGLDAGGGEDLDLTLRLRKAGWGVWFSPESICYTDVPDTFAAFIRQLTMTARVSAPGSTRNSASIGPSGG